MWFISLQIGKEGSKIKRGMHALFFFAKATDTEGFGLVLISLVILYRLALLSSVWKYIIFGNVRKKNLCPPQG